MKKLSLRKETLRALVPDQLDTVAGGVRALPNHDPMAASTSGGYTATQKCGSQYCSDACGSKVCTSAQTITR